MTILDRDMMHPYCTKEFAESLPHIGMAEAVPSWGTHVLRRPISNTPYFDSCGVYPITQFQTTSLDDGIQHLKNLGLISCTLVLTEDQLKTIPANRWHHLKPFKPHYIARSGIKAYTRYHRRYVSKAARQVDVGLLDLNSHLDEWIELYTYTADRHNFSPLHRFPNGHHETLASLNGITAVGAWVDQKLVSAHIWAHDQSTAHSHLVASNEQGYDTNAAYAVNDFSLNHFRHLNIVNFGGSAGLDGQLDGLARFKSGFCNDVMQSYIAGIILDPEIYATLSPKATPFFPAYRDPFLLSEVPHEHSR